MASNQQANPTGNSPSFRTRGLSLVLACVLMINVLLVVVAPTLQPEQATAQDQDASPAVAKKTESTEEPETAQQVDSAAQAVPELASDSSVSTGKVSIPQITKQDIQEHSVVIPPQVADIEPPTADVQEVAANVDDSTNSLWTDPVGSELENEATANTEEPSDDLNDEPSAEIQPNVVQPTPVALPKLLVVNPVETGGTVFHLVDGEVHSLAPGESHDLEEGLDHKIEFHRGEDFGDAEVVIKTGTYHFRVENNGWNLAVASSVE